jgi:hypothetical protein
VRQFSPTTIHLTSPHLHANVGLAHYIDIVLGLLDVESIKKFMMPSLLSRFTNVVLNLLFDLLA